MSSKSKKRYQKVIVSGNEKNNNKTESLLKSDKGKSKRLFFYQLQKKRKIKNLFAFNCKTHLLCTLCIDLDIMELKLFSKLIQWYLKKSTKRNIYRYPYLYSFVQTQ